MIQNLMLHSTPTNELLDLFRGIVKDELSSLVKQIEKIDSSMKLYTRKEVAKMLDISLPTLNDWTKDGKIKAHRIGTRVRYKEKDVEVALKEIDALKYARK